MIFRLFIFVSTFSNEAQNTLLYLINSFQDDNFWHRFCDFWEVPCSLEPGSPALPQIPSSWPSLSGLCACEKAHVEATPKGSLCALGEKRSLLYLPHCFFPTFMHTWDTAHILKGFWKLSGWEIFFSMWKELSDIIQVTGPSIGTFLQHPSLSQAYTLNQELAEETRH